MIIFGVIFGYDSEVDVFDNEDYREICPYDSANHDDLFENEEDDYYEEYPYSDWWYGLD